MLNRRAFLATGTVAMAGLFYTVPGFAQARKEVRVGGRRVRVIDIHAHCDFPAVADLIRGTSMEGADLSRVLGPQRIADMDEHGIDIAALSINRYWWYAADRDKATAIVRLHDQEMAKWCGAHADRFVALTSPAMQFPELAAEQLEYAVRELGARGASVGGSVAGEALSIAKYDPFWAKAQELGVPVFMHPDNASYIVQRGALAGAGGLGNIVGNPLETTVFLSRMIFDGALDRFPRLVVVGAHGGGFLPSYIGRSDVACERNNAKCQNHKKPSDYFKDQIVVDSMVFNEEGLRHLVAVGGASQVVYGSDMPHGWPDTIDLIVDSPTLSDAEKVAILGGNLERLLRIGA
jgi:aminocarboxymuconate-semialdehyde decarboxylase